MNDLILPLPLAALILLVLLLLSAFFSGSETALTRARKTRLRILKNNGDSGAEQAEELLKEPEKLLTAILLGNNLVNIAASSLTAGIFLIAFGEAGIFYATVAMTLIVVIFSEILPKTIAVAYAEPIACKIAIPLKWIVRVSKPVIIALTVITNLLRRMLKVPEKKETGFTHQDIATMVNLTAESGGLDQAREQMLANSLKLHEIPVKSLMTPRKNMVMLDASMNIRQAKSVALEHTHSRYPVYISDTDEIVSIIHIRDLMRLPDSDAQLMHSIHEQKPVYIPANRNALLQLFDFQKRQQHMALIVDEYGDIEGLITLEDILEDIVGEIVDEHDSPESLEAWKQPDDSFIVSGTANIHDLNQLIGITLPEETATTIGGLIVLTLGFQPEEKMCMLLENVQIEILQIQQERITRVHLRKALPPGTSSPG